MKKILERDIQAKILSWLQSKSIYAKKIIVANSSGAPDIFCCVGGSFIGLEVKRPGEHQTSLQVYNQYKIEKAGGKYFVVTSVDEVKKLIIPIINMYKTTTVAAKEGTK